jgi:hypothetical protein
VNIGFDWLELETVMKHGLIGQFSFIGINFDFA